MLTIECAQNPRWNNPEHSYFGCIVKYVEMSEPIPVGVMDNSGNEDIQEL